MARYRRVNALSDTDAAYIAGLVDGEGTVTLTRKHRGENRQLAVTIASCERALLEFVATAAGAGKITGKRVTKSAHSPSFAYAIYNRQALDLIRQIQPYLRTYKAERCRLALDRYLSLTPRNGKYSEVLLQQRNRFETRFLACTHQASSEPKEP